MTGRTHVAALAERVREAAGRLAQTENELDTAAGAFAQGEGWAPAIMLWESHDGGDGDILESVIATEHSEIDEFTSDARAPHMSRRSLAAWRREAHARLDVAAREWEAKRKRALAGIERRRADQLAALARHLRRLCRARATTLGDVGAKLRLVVEIPADMVGADQVARSAIRDLTDLGRVTA